MRWLRCTMYGPDYTPMMSTVAAEGNIEGDIEDAAAHMRALDSAFVIAAIEDLDIEDVQEATGRMMASIDHERERNMAILYWWMLDKLQIVTDHGVLMAPDPAPLTVGEITDTLRQIALHPTYRQGQRVVVPSEDTEHMVVLLNGDVTTEGI